MESEGLPECHDLRVALAQYQALAPESGGLWPMEQGVEETELMAWILQGDRLAQGLAQLSPQPRPEAEELVLGRLATLLAREPLLNRQHRALASPSADLADETPEEEAARKAQHQEEAARREAAWAQLVPLMDWPRHRQPRGVSLPYALLSQAMETEDVFDLAFPFLLPHLHPEDQTVTRSLLGEWLGELEAGNPAAQSVQTKLWDHSPPEVVGAHVVWAILDRDFSAYGLLTDQGTRTWPLPLAQIHAAKALPIQSWRTDEAHEAVTRFENQVTELLESPSFPLAPDLWLYVLHDLSAHS